MTSKEEEEEDQNHYHHLLPSRHTRNESVPKINLEIAINLVENSQTLPTPPSSSSSFLSLSGRSSGNSTGRNTERRGELSPKVSLPLPNLDHLNKDELTEFTKMLRSPRRNLRRLEEFGRTKNLDIKPHLREHASNMFLRLVQQNEVMGSYEVVHCIQETFNKIRDHCRFSFSHSINYDKKEIVVATSILEWQFHAAFSQYFDPNCASPPTSSTICLRLGSPRSDLSLIEILSFLRIKN